MPPPTQPAQGRLSSLGRKAGPLPVWAWALAGLAVVAVIYVTRPKTAAGLADTGSNSASPPTSGEGLTAGDAAPASGVSPDTLAALLDSNAQALGQLISRVTGSPQTQGGTTGAPAPSAGTTSQTGDPAASAVTGGPPSQSAPAWPGGEPAFSTVAVSGSGWQPSPEAQAAVTQAGAEWGHHPIYATGNGAATMPAGPSQLLQHGLVTD